MQKIGETGRNPLVASAAATLARQQGGTERSVRHLGPGKEVGGLGAAGLYSTDDEGRYSPRLIFGDESEPPYSDDGPSCCSDYNPW